MDNCFLNNRFRAGEKAHHPFLVLGGCTTSLTEEATRWYTHQRKMNLVLIKMMTRILLGCVEYNAST